jgi:hypothetical protein
MADSRGIINLNEVKTAPMIKIEETVKTRRTGMDPRME